MEFLGKKNKQPYASNNNHLESKEPIYIFVEPLKTNFILREWSFDVFSKHVIKCQVADMKMFRSLR